MNINGGDRTLSFITSSSLQTTKNNLERLSKEFTTGLVSDEAKRLNGNLSGIVSIRNSMKQSQALIATLSEAQSFSESKQNVIDTVDTTILDFGTNLNIQLMSNLPSALSHASDLARSALQDTVARVNTNVMGRFLFSGDSPKTSPLVLESDILSAVRTEISGLVTVDDIKTEIDSWFHTNPAGYASVAYQGSVSSSKNVRLDDVTKVAIPGRADTKAIVDVVQGLVIAALSNDAALNFSEQTKRELLVHAGEKIREGQTGLIDLRADIGEIQNRIEKSRIRNQFNISQSEKLILNLTSVDQESAAIELQQTQNQMEKLFAVMARNSQLSLLDYI